MSLILTIANGLLWLIIFSFILKRIHKRLQDPVPGSWVVIAFMIKIIAGIAYGYFFKKYYPDNDTWIYFSESVGERNLLLSDPVSFVTSFFKWVGHQDVPDFFSSEGDPTWRYAGTYLVIKLLAIFNVFSGNNYNVDVIFFNFFSFIGIYCIYRLSTRLLKGERKLIFILCFLFPGLLFWGSGIHKDGIILLLLGFLFVSTDRLMGKARARKWLWGMIVIVCLFVLFCLRNWVVLLAFPALVAWWIATIKRENPWRVFVLTYLVAVILFFLTGFLPDAFNLPLRTAERQHSFQSLHGNSELPLDTLQASATSYFRILPQALNHAFLRPGPFELKSPFYFLAFLELGIIYLLLIIYVVRFRSTWKKLIGQPYAWMLLFFAISSFVLVGYTIPFLGAIVRYRAIYEVLLLVPFVSRMSIGSKTYPGGI